MPTWARLQVGNFPPTTRTSRVGYKLTQRPRRFNGVARPICPLGRAVRVKAESSVVYDVGLPRLMGANLQKPILWQLSLAPHTRCRMIGSTG